MHPTQEDLLRFLHGREPEERAADVYAHIDTCEPCHDRLHALRRLHREFDVSWDEFLAEGALRFGSPGDRAGLVVRALLDGGRKLATLVAAGARDLAGSMNLQAVPRLAPEGIGDPGEASGAAARRAADCLARGDSEAAFAALARVAATRPDAAAAATLAIFWGGRPVGEIVIDARRRAVSVLLDRSAFDDRAPEIALRMLAGGPERRARPAPVEGADYVLAEFELLPDGAFVLELHVSRP